MSAPFRSSFNRLSSNFIFQSRITILTFLTLMSRNTILVHTNSINRQQISNSRVPIHICFVDVKYIKTEKITSALGRNSFPKTTGLTQVRLIQ